MCLCVCVCVCVCEREREREREMCDVCVCVCVCARALRIASMDKTLRFTNTLIIIIGPARQVGAGATTT